MSLRQRPMPLVLTDRLSDLDRVPTGIDHEELSDPVTHVGQRTYPRNPLYG